MDSVRTNWFFSVNYDGEFNLHPTAQEARAAAQGTLDSALDETWPEDIEGVCWGMVLEHALEVEREDHASYGHDTTGHWDAAEAGSDCPVPADLDWTCGYELLSREASIARLTSSEILAECGRPDGPAWAASEAALAAGEAALARAAEALIALAATARRPALP